MIRKVLKKLVPGNKFSYSSGDKGGVGHVQTGMGPIKPSRVKTDREKLEEFYAGPYKKLKQYGGRGWGP